ncbi:MAG: hypothetical protein DRO39_04105 [Thermoprotei archaeon]|nr:MAG: hypothetical protein DRO39_04105 [Thermoprotei archaeon]
MKISIGGVELGPRDKAFSELLVSTLSTGSELSIPFAVITGAEPGPILYVGAGSHGDEVTSMLVAMRIARDIGPDDIKRGALVVTPMHNPLAVLRKKRWGIVDNLDMNRVWPGDPEGNVSELIVHKIFSELVMKSDYALDLHTAAGDGENVPHAILPPEGVFTPRSDSSYAAKKDVTPDMARYFGVRFVARSRIREEKERKYYQYVYGELHVAATMRGVPAIVVELGEGGRVSRNAYELGYSGVLNVARYLGILEGVPEEHPQPVMLKGPSKAVRAPRGGVVTMKVSPGDRVSQGDIVAVLDTLWEQIEVRSPIDGYVVRVRRYGIVEPGERIAVIVGGEG